MLVKRLGELLDKKVSKKTDAAVVVPVFDEKCPKIVMIKRSKGLNRSAGHIAFPGGMIEDGENEVEAALREFEEELGINPECVDVLGFLRPREVHEYRIMICPVVGMIRTLDFVPDGREVSRVLVDELRKVLKSRRITDWGPNFECAGQLVWGASSRVLDDLYLRIVRRYGSVDAFFEGI
ncbi:MULTISPECIES: CoA pyrophosphatase [Archaeoglobus]|uniref:Mutator protein MutT, putative n=3 Tax=Archaeoglobus fulgidus TaxID=2234 RepID=O28083_ARCFU|nr:MULTISPECIES: CoA pyrophosphatase [Archaeoglobus]AAB89052.1 mutator protein MutT, putative [Archaeoglobus fulgidus DSM 4304]AIG99188.1 ADP-ribose pyrophosphatase [Archaeoglobus fulgidus DSM 8774]KUJ93322.1 MAG: Mutator protein MutT, putative [Archaeoglobus fulgidus]KUK07337.1 MAG: Mutator protein MutT, putative [Archaeoglobus fulgidus]MDI3498573.1 hypothetical protein [Archaeoglobus sp.]